MTAADIAREYGKPWVPCVAKLPPLGERVEVLYVDGTIDLCILSETGGIKRFWPANGGFHLDLSPRFWRPV